MNEDGETKLEMKDLVKFMKAMKAMELPKIRVGILGDKVTRAKSVGSTNNADIGLKHEMGIGVPQRSFLRMPMTNYFKKALESSEALDKEVLKQVIKEVSVVPWMKKISVIAEGVVVEAFASGGYGEWKAHAPGYTNNTGMILVDTQQLRNSITSEVKET